MLDLGELKASIIVDDNDATKKLNDFGESTTKAEGKLKGFASKVGSLATKGMVALGASIVAVGGMATKAFGDFEESLNKVETIADTTVMSMDEIKEGVIDLSNEMGIASGDLNEALYQTISATGDTGNALAYVETASKLAKGGFTEVTKAIDGATSVMNAYGQSGEENFNKIADIMITTQNLGKTSVDELAGSLYNVIPTASSLGVEFEQVGAAMATMTAQGTPTSVATTQLRSAMQELSKDGTKASDIFKKMSGQTFKEFIVEGGNLSDAMLVMGDYAQKSNLEISDLFSSTEAGAVALALTGDGADKFNESLLAMNDSAGATQLAYETMSKGINDAFGKLKNAMGNVLIQLGDKLAPLFEKLANWIIEHMPEIQAIIETTFEVVGQVIDVVVGVIQEVISWFDNLLENNTELKEELTLIWNSTKEMFNKTFKEVSKLVSAFIDWCVRAWDKYGQDIIAIIKPFWEHIKNIFKTGFDVVVGLVDFFTAFFEGDFEGMSEAITNIIENLWQFIKDAFHNGLEFFTNLIPTMWNIGCDLFSSLWDGIKAIWSGIGDWVQEKVDWLADKLMFWRKSETEMSLSSRNIDGSHASGINYVPFDGYTAQLHKGERVLTAEQARNYSDVSTSRMENLLEQLNVKLDRLPRNLVIEGRF